MNLENWVFYVVPTKVINEIFGDQKVLSLKKLKELKPYNKELTWNDIKKVVDEIINDPNNFE